MPITVAHLELLSRHFHFDINEARVLIGLPVKIDKINQQKPFPKKSTDKRPDIISGFISANSSDPKPKRPSTPRGPTGYNLYVKNAGISFKDAASSWRSLSQDQKDHWNKRAKSL